MTSLAWGMATHQGRVRSENQDSALADETLFVVADGMGGHAGGSVASTIVVDYFRDNVDPLGVGEVIEGTHRANAAIIAAVGDNPDLKGMGTTLCVLALVEGEGDDRLVITNVGDSRVYHFKDGELEQVTEDHSLVETLRREGRLSDAEAAVHPQRNVLTRALGIDEKVLVDDWAMLPFEGDRYLLCSDGLFNEVSDNEIAGVLRRLADPQEVADELVRLANEGGGRDNITVVVVDVVDDGGRAERASALKAKATNDRVAEHHRAVPDRATIERPTPPPVDDEPMRLDRRKAFSAASLPGMTWRVLLFGGVVAVVAAVAIGSLVAYARDSYYVGFADTEVVIYKGRPGGVLWFDPTIQERTDLQAVDVPPARQEQLRSGFTTGSLDEARGFVANLRDEISVLVATTTTTTTTLPGPTSTAPFGPTTTTAGGTDAEGPDDAGTGGVDGGAVTSSTSTTTLPAGTPTTIAI